MVDKMIDYCKTYLPTFNEVMEISKCINVLQLTDMNSNMYWNLPESLVDMVYFVNFMNYRLYVHGEYAYNVDKYNYPYMKFSLMYDDHEPDLTTCAPTMYTLQHPKWRHNPFVDASSLQHEEINASHVDRNITPVLVVHLMDGTISIIHSDDDEFKLLCDDIVELYIEESNKRISEY